MHKSHPTYNTYIFISIVSHWINSYIVRRSGICIPVVTAAAGLLAVVVLVVVLAVVVDMVLLVEIGELIELVLPVELTILVELVTLGELLEFTKWV